MKTKSPREAVHKRLAPGCFGTYAVVGVFIATCNQYSAMVIQ